MRDRSSNVFSRLLWRLLLIPAGLLLAPLMWIGVGLLMLGIGGEPWALKIAEFVPAVPEFYDAFLSQSDDQGTQELMRAGLALAGILSLSCGYFPLYDLWKRGCDLPPEPEDEEEEVYFIP